MKNGRMQFWRIVFTYLIAYYHLNNSYNCYKSWYLGVEFFFLVSGYLLAKKYESYETSGNLDSCSAWAYTWNKYKRFIPHSAYAFFVAWIITGIYEKYSVGAYAINFIKHLPELFLVDAVGLNLSTTFFYNSVTWYLSVLLISGYIIWFCLKKNKKMYLELVLPLTFFIIFPYLYREYGSLAEHREVKYLIMNSALLRGFAELNCGILAYYLSQKVIKEKMNAKIVAIASDVMLIAAIAVSSLYYRKQWDFLVLLLLFIGVVFGFACDWNPLFNNKLIDKWGAISISIYLNHKIFRSAMKLIWHERGIVVYIAWFVFITVYSAITYYGINWIVAQITKNKMRRNK